MRVGGVIRNRSTTSTAKKFDSPAATDDTTMARMQAAPKEANNMSSKVLEVESNINDEEQSDGLYVSTILIVLFLFVLSRRCASDDKIFADS
jgi:uncharacterized protein YfcZ (UPF0381/DUF406 family)